MKAIVNTAPGRLEMLDRPKPEPGPGQVRIRTAACGICATDLQMIAGWERTGFPAVPGHEWSGVVDAAGPDAPADRVGRRCVAENVMSDGREVGFEHPGGYGEYFVTEAANVHVLPPDLPFATASLIEPLAVCVRGVRRLRPDDRRGAVVFGDGPIGLLALMLLRREGVRRLGLVGGRPGRLALARALGADWTVDYHAAGDALASAVRADAPDAPVGSLLETSGSGAALAAALAVAPPGAKILVLGDYGAIRAGFLWNEILHREIELIGSNASAGAWPEAVRLAQEADFPLERLVTHRLPAARFAEGVELVRNRNSGAIKVILEWV